MDRSNIYNVVHLSLSFVFILMAYNVTQTFQTSSDYAENGAFALGILYLAFSLTNLTVSSYGTQLLGVKWTLALSSLSYVAFIAANIKYNMWTLYATALINGIGAALLWTGQGVYVTLSINKHEQVNNLNPSSTQGFINGIFFGLFQLNQIFGNLAASYLFRLKFQQWKVFMIMTAISSTGSFALLFLRPIKIPENKKQKPSIQASLSILLEIPFLLLVPMMCYSGISQGFIFASLPPLILDRSQKFLIFALFGLVNALASVLFGKLSDVLNRRLLILAVGTIAHMTIFGLLLVVWKPPLSENRLEIYAVLVSGLAIGDAIFMTQLYAIVSIFYGKTRPADAFSLFKAFQAGAAGLGFVAQLYISLSNQILFLILLLSVSLIALIYEHFGIMSLDAEESIIPVEKQNTDEMETELEVQIPLTTAPSNV